MNDQLNTLIETMKDEAIETLQKWIRIPSVKGPAAPGAPFGKEVGQMLEIALADCRRLGLETRNFNGYAGDAQMGESGEVVGILAHLDVVPAGDGWLEDPFKANIHDGAVYGRGTSDDKGPAVAALYAMAAVKQAGIPLKKKVRLILGCDEESGMEDMEYYSAHADLPAIGFSPDASYPVINTEKGRAELLLSGPISNEGLTILSLQGGERANVIPGLAKAVVKGNAALIDQVKAFSQKTGYPLEAKEINPGEIEITSIGKIGHAAFPDGGRNANCQLLLALTALGAKGSVAWFAQNIAMQTDGKSLNVAITDHISGPLTLNVGILTLEKGILQATLDIRYPVLTNDLKMIELIATSATKAGLEVTVSSNKGPHHVPEDSFLVQALLEAYHQVTGREKKALAIGGGTYARWLRTGVAFRAQFPEEEELAHQAGENITLDSFFKNVQIIAQAIINLAG